MKPQTPTISAARRVAYRFLLRVETENSYTSHLLQSESMEPLRPADRRLATALVMGVLRWKRRLDWVIENYAGRSIDDIDLEAQILLRMAFYQLRFMTKIPAHAVVHEAVEQAKTENRHHLSGFINAVLRRGLSDPGVEQRIALIKAPERRLSIMGSHPEWLMARWIERYGTERALQWAQANNTTPVTALHINRRKTSREAVLERLQAHRLDPKPSQYFSDTLLLDGVAPIIKELCDEGLVHLQDEASRMVATLLGDCTGLTVLDLCAAPGGKSILLSRAVGESGRVIAMDRYSARLQVLQKRRLALGLSNVAPLVADATEPLPIKGLVDVILVDAPCSGLGTLQRNPEIKWKADPADFGQLAAKQSALLGRAAPHVKIEGRLLYSTCSTEPEENEGVVDRFLKDHPEFTRLDPELTPAIEKFFDRRSRAFRTFPGDGRADGFFAVLLKKTGIDQPPGVTEETERLAL
ncbi:MAG: 16S rRNA (cytosine(967)-C(5))-methyltransferase RsmB [Acidobacteria bacterium]|nr:16S rRNA (cytosine(967)-C(5))-methyltransferase RsmB [Acidobacteriota bacterium]MBI3656740.1 16S rRNA (cytosine(967)-C(5))-methyltransferase RsmB [Acidobacteriota bacterium]